MAKLVVIAIIVGLVVLGAFWIADNVTLKQKPKRRKK